LAMVSLTLPRDEPRIQAYIGVGLVTNEVVRKLMSRLRRLQHGILELHQPWRMLILIKLTLTKFLEPYLVTTGIIVILQTQKSIL
jgi:hypothetical protein